MHGTLIVTDVITTVGLLVILSAYIRDQALLDRRWSYSGSIMVDCTFHFSVAVLSEIETGSKCIASLSASPGRQRNTYSNKEILFSFREFSARNPTVWDVACVL